MTDNKTVKIKTDGELGPLEGKIDKLNARIGNLEKSTKSYGQSAKRATKEASDGLKDVDGSAQNATDSIVGMIQGVASISAVAAALAALVTAYRDLEKAKLDAANAEGIAEGRNLLQTGVADVSGANERRRQAFMSNSTFLTIAEEQGLVNMIAAQDRTGALSPDAETRLAVSVADNIGPISPETALDVAKDTGMIASLSTKHGRIFQDDDALAMAIRFQGAKGRDANVLDNARKLTTGILGQSDLEGAEAQELAKQVFAVLDAATAGGAESGTLVSALNNLTKEIQSPALKSQEKANIIRGLASGDSVTYAKINALGAEAGQITDALSGNVQTFEGVSLQSELDRMRSAQSPESRLSAQQIAAQNAAKEFGDGEGIENQVREILKSRIIEASNDQNLVSKYATQALYGAGFSNLQKTENLFQDLIQRTGENPDEAIARIFGGYDEGTVRDIVMPQTRGGSYGQAFERYIPSPGNIPQEIRVSIDPIEVTATVALDSNNESTTTLAQSEF